MNLKGEIGIFLAPKPDVDQKNLTYNWHNIMRQTALHLFRHFLSFDNHRRMHDRSNGCEAG